MLILFLPTMIYYLYSQEYCVFLSSVLPVTNDFICSLNSHVVIYTYILNDTAVCCIWFPWYVTNFPAQHDHGKISLRFLFNENVLLKHNGGFSMRSSETRLATLNCRNFRHQIKCRGQVDINTALCLRGSRFECQPKDQLFAWTL